MIESVLKTSQRDNVVIYIGLSGNGYGYDFLKHYPCVKVLTAKDWTTAYTWNLLAEEAKKDASIGFFMLGADDMVFSTPCWDMALIKFGEDAVVVSFLDSRDSEGTPHPVMSRSFHEKLGYFTAPIFLHWYVDTWLVAIAKACGRFHHLKQYFLVHDKLSDKGTPDETHNDIRRRGWRERDKYTWDKCQHFLFCEQQRMLSEFLTS